jgi:hypothetical protein
VLLDRVEIVEQPLSGRADVDPFIGRLAESLPRVEEEIVRLFQALEERDRSAPFAGWPDALPSGERAGVLPKTVGAEQLAPNGPDERLLSTVRSAR